MGLNKKIFYSSAGLLGLITCLSVILYIKNLTPLEPAKDAPEMSGNPLQNTARSIDPKIFLKELAFMDKQEAALQEEYKRAGHRYTDQWKQFSARQSIEIRDEFLRFDEALVKELGTSELSSDVRRIREDFEKYRDAFQFFWRELNSVLMKKDNQLQAAAEILKSSRAALDERISIYSKSSETIGQ